MGDKLTTYWKKRDFSITPEPKGITKKSKTGFSYLIQKHAATRLHYDFRLELDGVLLSWAVTRGPSYDPNDRRLAVHTEDHPLDYGSFEGIIPKGQYGGGTVMMWDQGTWEPIGDPREGMRKGKLDFKLHGKRLLGEWTLIRMNWDKEKRDNWLLIKKDDEFAEKGKGETWLETQGFSIVTKRKMEEIASDKKAVWQSKRSNDNPINDTKPKSKIKKEAQPKKAKTKKSASNIPDFVEPQLATLSDAMPKGDSWVHEVKFDGYRVFARIEGGEVKMLTRRGQDWTDKFISVAKDFKRLKAENAMIDGELVVVNEAGASSFKDLQEALSEEDIAKLQFYAFDLLFLDGEDWRSEALVDRKAKLKEIIQKSKLDRVFYSEHFEAGREFLENACSMRLEGVISKLADRPYLSGRSKDWLKSKCHLRQEFVIGGFTLSTNNTRGIGSLILGVYDGDDFIYVGKVGTGFNTESSLDIRKKLDRIRSEKTHFKKLTTAQKRDALWVEPRLVCEIEFTEWTGDGSLRHPSFQGLREDKQPKDVKREEAISLDSVPKAKQGVTMKQSKQTKKLAKPAPKTMAKPSSKNRVDIGGISVSSPDRVIFPEEGYNKQMLAEYYESVAEHMLPYIANRPISIIRCPESITGGCFFQRHINEGNNPHIEEVDIEIKKSTSSYIYIKDVKGLISLIQLGVIEIHPWGSKNKNVELPDKIVFDLDPDPGIPWERVVEGTFDVKERLENIGLQSYIKTTGGKGLHVVVPIKPKHDWEVVKMFAKLIAEAMAGESPKKYVSNMSKALRKGKIFIDYLRNDRTATAVGNFSVRARPGALVATPISWDEVKRIKPQDFDIFTVPKRLQKMKKDPWADFLDAKQTITASVLKKFQP